MRTYHCKGVLIRSYVYKLLNFRLFLVLFLSSELVKTTELLGTATKALPLGLLTFDNIIDN